MVVWGKEPSKYVVIYFVQTTNYQCNGKSKLYANLQRIWNSLQRNILTTLKLVRYYSSCDSGDSIGSVCNQ